MKFRIQAFSIMLFCLTCVFTVGCGDKTYTVEGTVTYKGEPVEAGAISFVPSDPKKSSDGASIEKGKYSCPAHKGVMTVRITGSKPNPPDELGLISWSDYIPDEHGSKSTLTVEIKGNQTENFDLK